METTVRKPITIALIDDYDIMVMGAAHILEQYRDRIVAVSRPHSDRLDTNQALSDTVDIVLCDSFAQPESNHEVAVYTWNLTRPVESARRQGVKGCLAKALPPAT
jgi:DNA-binding NarL/FixJ family response regulator